MPELPEVETVRRGLEGSVLGATIKKVTLRRENLRTAFPPGFAKSLAGRKITAISRRAKYLLFYLDADMVLIAHLGMTGRFSVVPEIPGEKGGNQFAAHDHVVLTLDDGRLLIYNDARRFGVMDICKREELKNHKLLAHLAPEPLGEEFTPGYLQKALGKRATPVKPALMDQKIVVGVGNIYANEALFMSGISPLRAANSINDKIPLLISNIHNVLNNAIAAGGSTLRDFTHVSGESGYFQHNFHVYGRAGKPCPRCKSPIISVRQAGRASFYCENCQK
jgi:formamidopyrimidine-DNA glycosylase